MKVLFLDIDGVLNSFAWMRKRAEQKQKLMNAGQVFIDEENGGLFANPAVKTAFDPDNIEQLNRVCEATGCHIIVSSTWRKLLSLSQLREVLAYNDFKFPERVVGKTPNSAQSCSRWRGDEIQECLDSIAKGYWGTMTVEKFAIVDDGSDMEHLTKFLVQTTIEAGLTKAEADLLIEMLR